MKNTYSYSILIVDDNLTNIKLLLDVLNQSGFRVSIAKSGENALLKLQETLPDLILLDVMMPGIDGFETCRQLKENPKTKDIPVIFMTALSELVNKVKGLQVGGVDYITKPIEPEEVLARINVHLQLRKMQLQLIQTEKMSSLGQLVGGVAHEINNPINFIYGNIFYAQQYVRDLLKTIQLYEQYLPPDIPEIEQWSEEIDLQFLKNDLPQLLSSMEVGANRIRDLVRSLRVFSRLDESQLKTVDLKEGIESTLMLLSHRLKSTSHRPEIQVIQDYDRLSTIECYASEINQVFIHLFNNAIDAIDSKITMLENKPNHQEDFKPKITIKIESITDKCQLMINISDNGIGMSSEVIRRSFDQFFTTKPVGQGTGLGLAITYAIVVDKHGGTLTCSSEVGEGSDFTITLPFYQEISYSKEQLTGNKQQAAP
ncbi:sensor histidine kinase [Planktothrix paucivesiculata]|uniref:histidine kinase n=1 Tax=Planktothrix paucivesiculata PCC 9631 TaxID=671071 RepID=A0A7Z9E4C2_9CYAN|nr:response regulator [Planktothrix paucivesiculata]VXD24773.1 Response Regulator Receiver Signal Transduction Histidine Kinase [Planktothrix paucivesiculata PCC 9631]